MNAADAFDIGSFDEEDTKGIKVPGRRGRAVGGQGWQAAPDPAIPACFPARQLLESDQELYRNFPLTISERWQQEVTETVFEAVNADTDKLEARKKAKNKQLGHEEGEWGRVSPRSPPHSPPALPGPVAMPWADLASPRRGGHRVRHGQGLHHARVHGQAGQPLPDAVAAPLLLPLPQPPRVAWGGRVAGKAGTGRGWGGAQGSAG